MSQEFVNIDRPGYFQGVILDYGLKEMDSGSVAISVRAQLTGEWTGEGWSDWSAHKVQAYGDLWIVKKDGTLNQPQIDAICKHAAWDGDITAIAQQTWRPAPCQFSISEETYKDKQQFKIAFINAFDKQPGSLGSMDADRAKQLQAKYGSQLRALAGDARRNAAPAGGKPASPPPRHTIDPAEAAAAANSKPGDDGIPFGLLIAMTTLASAFMSMV